MKGIWLRRLIYLIVVMGTASFAFYQYKYSQEQEEKEEKKDLVFSSLEPNQVQSIFIRKVVEDIHLIRTEDGWNMESSIEDMADRDLTGDWLSSLFSEKARIIKEKGVDWAEYGLDRNTKSIVITTKSNEKLKLSISNYSAFDGSFYIKKEEKLLLGGTAWASLTGKKGDYFRSYKLLNIGKKHPKSLSYQSKAFSVSLNWENNKWEWKDKNPVFPLSQSDLESYWSSFSNINFERDTYPDTKKYREEFYLHNPAIELQLEFEDNKKWSVKISPEIKGKFYVLPSTRQYIFALNKEQMDNLLLTNKKIRDHRHPFQFKKDHVHFVELKGYGLEVEAEKEEKKWKLLHGEINKEIMDKIMPKSVVIKNEKDQKQKEDKKEEPTDKDKEKEAQKKLKESELHNILNRIRTLFAREYFDSEKSFTKTAQLILKNKEKNILLNLEFSDPFERAADKKNKHSGDEKIKMIYVKSSAGKEIMTIRFDDLKFIFSRDLLQID